MIYIKRDQVFTKETCPVNGYVEELYADVSPLVRTWIYSGDHVYALLPGTKFIVYIKTPTVVVWLRIE